MTTVYKYQNEGLKYFNIAENKDSKVIERLTSILENMVERKMDISSPNPKKGSEGCNVRPLSNIYDFFNYGKREKYQCKHLVEVGGKKTTRGFKDGSKFVCFDGIVPGNCVVLSFGINFEWSFDDAMYDYGCTVYAFDPTMGVKNHNRSPGIHFYNLGLSNFKGDKTIKDQICKVDRYENILEMLNLTSKRIDYVKMDIEGSEIDFFTDVFKNSPRLLDNVKQLGVEIHPGQALETEKWPNNKRSTFNMFWQIMNRLECRGFKLLHYEPNNVPTNYYMYENRTESNCYEIVWIK